MKKIYLAIFTFLISFSAIDAQVFEKGDKIINAGIGFGTYYSGGYNMVIPPVGISFEYAIADNIFDENSSIGIGAYLGFAKTQWTSVVDTKHSANYTMIGAKGNFHYQFVDKLDTYAGLMIGYLNHSWDFKDAGYKGYSGLMPGFYVGARYYFANTVAVFAELGYGISYLQIGASFKL